MSEKQKTQTQTEPKVSAEEQRLLEERKKLNEELRAVRGKNKWLGDGSIWQAFRKIGVDFARDTDLTTEAKKKKLASELTNFINERLS